MKKAKIPEGTIFSLSDKRIITIYDKEGAIVGEIDFSASKVIFDGNVNDAADRFFSFIKHIIDPFFMR